MADLDLEAEYNKPPARAGSPLRSVRGWQAASIAYRKKARVPISTSHMARGERQRYDLFYAGAANAPLVVYIHGGYWQRGERQDNSFVAPRVERGWRRRGASVVFAVPVRVGDADRRGTAAVPGGAVEAKRKKHPVVIGHSAGGSSDGGSMGGDPTGARWAGRAGPNLGAQRLRHQRPSSIWRRSFPPASTTWPGMDAQTAAAASPPALAGAAQGRRTLVAAVGGDESSEFHRQGARGCGHLGARRP